MLNEQADINYTIHKGQLPNLYFDFKLDAAAYNGKMYSTKTLDFNGLKHTESVERTIQEYEVVVNRMNEVAANNGLDRNGEYWLVVDPYQGNISELKSLYKLIEGGVPGIKVAPSSAIAEFSAAVIESGAKPLSQLIDAQLQPNATIAA